MIPEIVINFHVTERCNYHCGFCFGNWRLDQKSDEIFDDIPRGKKLIKDISRAIRQYFGPRQAIRATFAGGEPALLKSLPELVELCRWLNMSTSFISNGLMLRRYAPEWIARNFDVVGLSIDSISPMTNLSIGRNTASGQTLDLDGTIDRLLMIRRHGHVETKINTVVCRSNLQEDMADVIRRIAPNRWKLFQVLPVYDRAQRISPGEFRSFVDRHAEFAGIISTEDNDLMTGSYLMVDPVGRFFWRDQSSRWGYRYSARILDIGAEQALREVPLNWEKYRRRYGKEARPS